MRTHSKRGGLLGDFLAKFAAYLLLAFILLGIYLLMKGQMPAVSSIKGSSGTTTIDIVLLNYLRSPSPASSTQSISDIILRYESDRSYSSESFKKDLQVASSAFFEPHTNLFYRILISEQPSFIPPRRPEPIMIEGKTPLKENGPPLLVDGLSRSCTLLPNDLGEDPVKIELILQSLTTTEYSSNANGGSLGSNAKTFSC
ncbi:MAG: hypothetical protein A2Z88_01190 [Omnitrophica WOR_2 bacterium GWA2_47_8]|nr:MAG: hypothetical protein A2Z88_01190 [Omnitrophica WOR_2 bacterium GWA2_47_8]